MNNCIEINLKAECWTTKVLPQVGMNTISLTWRGRELLRKPADVNTLKLNPCVYGIPILMPPNRTEGGQFTFDGKVYKLPINETAYGNHIHGLVHSQEFSLSQVSESMVSGIYENGGETYPFPYRLEANYCLTGYGYAQEFLFTNTGKQDMPLAFGLHTVFDRPSWIRVPIDKRWAVNSRYIPTGDLEPLTAELEEYRTGVDPSRKLIRGFYTSCGNEVDIDDFRYRVSSSFDQWVLWNGDEGSGFCAIEPMQGAVNSLNSGAGLLRLKPGEMIRFATLIYHAE